jgi:hypothetical protein
MPVRLGKFGQIPTNAANVGFPIDYARRSNESEEVQFVAMLNGEHVQNKQWYVRREI